MLHYSPNWFGCIMPGVHFMVRMVGLGSSGPEFKSCFAVELIPGAVDSACHPSKVSKMSTSILLAGMIEPFEYPASEWRPVQDCAQ